MQFNFISRLSLEWRIFIGAMAWFIVISFLHYRLNFEHQDRRIITLGYMPVITNLSAPILDQASKDGSSGAYRFVAMKFASFAEMAESLRHGHIDGAFIIAPLSIVLNQQGENVKIVYIGNRHESTFVTRKDLNIHSLPDLAGKTIAVPIRYSGHNLALRRLLAEKAPLMDVDIVEMNPPDMAAALSAGSLDGYFVGEPFAAKTLFAGKSQRFYYVEEIWNGFICNLLIVRNDLIKTEPNAVKALVTGAIRAGLWAKEHQNEAAQIAAKYWNQPFELVQYAMNTPSNRIVFDRFIPKEKEMQEIADLMLRFGLTESADIKDLIDAKFAETADLNGITNLRSVLPR